jgi:transcription elongation factor Elf1
MGEGIMICKKCGSKMELKLKRLFDGAKLIWICPKCNHKEEWTNV